MKIENRVIANELKKTNSEIECIKWYAEHDE